jgi:hypothetical protein
MYFLTTYFIFFVFLHAMYNVIVFDLHLMSLIIFVFGLHITYEIGKIKFTIRGKDYEVTGNNLVAINFFTHVVPFVYLWGFHIDDIHRYTNKQIILGLLFLALYWVMIDVCKVYHVRNKGRMRYIWLFCLTVYAIYVFSYDLDIKGFC